MYGTYTFQSITQENLIQRFQRWRHRQPLDFKKKVGPLALRFAAPVCGL